MSRYILALSVVSVAGLPGFSLGCARAVAVQQVAVQSFGQPVSFVQQFGVQQFAVSFVQPVSFVQQFAVPQVSITDVRVRRGFFGRVRRISTVNVNSFGVNSVRIGRLGFGAFRIGGFRGFRRG